MSEDFVGEIDLYRLAKEFLDKIPSGQLIKLVGGLGLAYIAHVASKPDAVKLPNALMAFAGYNIVMNAESEAGATIGATLLAASGLVVLGGFLEEEVKRKYEENVTSATEIGKDVDEHIGDPHYDEWLGYMAMQYIRVEQPLGYCEWLRKYYPEAVASSKCL